MDRTTFDLLTVMLSRRGVVRTIAAALAGGVALAETEASATTNPVLCRSLRASCTRNTQCCSAYCERRTVVPRRQRFRCSCQVGFANCDGVCTELGTEENCSSCGDACTGYDTCYSGSCIDACSLLVCGIDETCWHGACRKPCVSGTCAGTDVCLPDPDICIPNACLADAAYSEWSECLMMRDGSIAPNVALNQSDQVCTSDDECPQYFVGSDMKDIFPDKNYRIACPIAGGYRGDPDARFINECVEFVY